jgi:hypothetical protein
MTTDLVWRMRCGVLGDWTRHVRRHVLEYLAQPLNNIIVVDFAAGHPRHVFVARVLVPRVSRAISGCTLLFMKLKATCSALSPASIRALIFFIGLGSWIPLALLAPCSTTTCASAASARLQQLRMVVVNIEPLGLLVLVRFYQLVR